MQFRPLHDRVLARRLDEDERTTGGIIIPDTAKEKPMRGEVVAAGPGARNGKGVFAPMDVAVGDTVLFGKYSGTGVKIDGEEEARFMEGFKFNLSGRLYHLVGFFFKVIDLLKRWRHIQQRIP